MRAGLDLRFETTEKLQKGGDRASGKEEDCGQEGR